MGKMFIALSDVAERKLRLAVVMRLGGKKGDLSDAIEEAVNDWLIKKNVWKAQTGSKKIQGS